MSLPNRVKSSHAVSFWLAVPSGKLGSCFNSAHSVNDCGSVKPTTGEQDGENSQSMEGESFIESNTLTEQRNWSRPSSSLLTFDVVFAVAHTVHSTIWVARHKQRSLVGRLALGDQKSGERMIMWLTDQYFPS
jgi:hypothetical protein